MQHINTFAQEVAYYREQNRRWLEEFPKAFPILAASLGEAGRVAEEIVWYTRWLARLRERQQNVAVLRELGASAEDIERIEHEASVAAACTKEEVNASAQLYAAWLLDLKE